VTEAEQFTKEKKNALGPLCNEDVFERVQKYLHNAIHKWKAIRACFH